MSSLEARTVTPAAVPALGALVYSFNLQHNGGLGSVTPSAILRVGSGFGQGVAQRECVVTGGIGNITVSYQGQTYYVCCTGCKDLFEEDPAGVLAEYKERVAKRLKEPKK